MAMFGAMRFTNAVFAEADDELPPGWLPHGTQRHGFDPGHEFGFVVFASGVANIRRRARRRKHRKRTR
jgi:hypothetical protein